MKIHYTILIALSACLIQTSSYTQSPCISQPLDVVFIVDVTSSMREELEELPEVLGRLIKSFENADMQTGGIVFRDYGERFIFQSTPLTGETQQSIDFLTSFPAVGGGDDPEPLNEALMQLWEFTWRKNAHRLVFFLSDAPPRFPDQNEAVINHLLDRQVQVVALTPTSATDATLSWQRQVAYATGGLRLDWNDKYWIQSVAELICPPPREVSLEEEREEAPTLSIYPNPAQQNTTLRAASNMIRKVEIWDHQGKLRFAQSGIETDVFHLDLKQWAPGLYLIQTDAGSGKLMVVQ